MSFSLYDEQKIKSELEKIICPIHGKYPGIIFIGDRFRLMTCCEEFADFIQEELLEAVKNSANESINQRFEQYLKDSL